jgi:hypothetical protein
MLNDPPQNYVESTLGELRALSEELWWEFSIQQAIVLIDDLTRVNRILVQALRERHPSPEIIAALSALTDVAPSGAANPGFVGASAPAGLF